MKYINITLIAILIATTIVLWREVKKVQLESKALKVQMDSITQSSEGEHYELAEVMGRMQTHFGKLWFAGKAENWPLAQFYTHEIEESLEELVEANVIDEGMEISKLAGIMTKQPFMQLETAVEKELLPGFEGAYKRMMITCNQCHQTTKHSFIKVAIPSTPSVSNQQYKP